MDPGQDCVSRKPWSEVLNRSLKLFTVNMARESGRSLGRIVFFVLLAVLALGVLTWALDAVTGWFGGLFDFFPFGSDAPVEETESSWWKVWGAEEPTTPAPAPRDDPWYCRYNPIC